MPSITLEPENQHQLAQRMQDDVWVVACLCAAWCDVCTSYRPGFDELAAQHPDKLFIWIDIEDSADLIGDFDVENFPTLLIQRGDDVMFYGTTMPDHRIAHRLITSHADKNNSELKQQAQSSAEYQEWQLERNLRKTLTQT
ncbi:thioredoxin family protein [Herminiimonas sp. NPDC097707]|uniref:thioredoxin family protein n=1 Tax=Herminiimonas sp. NPDC097707 TaxID=3364007 RepID=UPI00383A6FB5